MVKRSAHTRIRWRRNSPSRLHSNRKNQGNACQRYTALKKGAGNLGICLCSRKWHTDEATQACLESGAGRPGLARSLRNSELLLSLFSLPLEISTPHVCQSTQDYVLWQIDATATRLHCTWPQFSRRFELWGADGGVATPGLASLTTAAPVDPVCWHCLGNRLNKLFLFCPGWMHGRADGWISGCRKKKDGGI